MVEERFTLWSIPFTLTTTVELAQTIRGDGDSLGNPHEFLNRVEDTWGGISLPPQEETVAEREAVKARKRGSRLFISQADRASALADEIYYTSEVRTELWERIEKAVRAQG